MLKARTRLGAQPLCVQSAIHACAGREARVLKARTRLGAQPLCVQLAIHAGARVGCGLNVERLRTELSSDHKAALTEITD